MADTSDEPVCIKCEATSSLLWQKNQSGALLCLECYSHEKRNRLSRSPAPQRTTSSAQAASSESNNTSSSSQSSTSNNQQAQSVTDKPSTSKHHTSTINTRRTTRARERTNRAKQQQQVQQQQQPVQQVLNVGSAASTPPSPATSTNSTSKEKVNSKPSLNGTHDCDNSGEDGQQKGRRSLKQGQPTRAPSPEAVIVTSDSIIHKVW